MEFPIYFVYLYYKQIINMKIKSYYKTTEIDNETLSRAIASAKDQENKIFKLYKQFGLLTLWVVFLT